MEKFISTFKNYLDLFGSTLWNLWFPLFMLLLCIALAFFISFFIARKKRASDRNSSEEKRMTITKGILNSTYWAGIATLSIATIVVIILQKETSFFIEKPCQIGIIIGYIIICIMAIVSFVKWGKQIKKREMTMVDLPLSRKRLSSKVLFLKRNMTPHLFLGGLLLALPFLLLFLPFSQKGCLSIVIDNSGTMQDNLPSVSESLTKALEGSACENFIFTTIDLSLELDTTRDPNVYFDNIVKAKTPSDLPTNTNYLNSSDQLIAQLSSVGDAGGSAIYQGIWQNFLTLVEKEQDCPANRKLIVITDGMDNLYSFSDNSNQKWDSRNIFEIENESGKTPRDLYDGGIYAINYGDESSNMFADCSFDYIYDGNQRNAYYEAFDDILTETRFDWILIWIIAGMLIISFLALLISKSTVK